MAQEKEYSPQEAAAVWDSLRQCGTDRTLFTVGLVRVALQFNKWNLGQIERLLRENGSDIFLLAVTEAYYKTVNSTYQAFNPLTNETMPYGLLVTTHESEQEEMLQILRTNKQMNSIKLPTTGVVTTQQALKDMRRKSMRGGKPGSITITERRRKR